MISPESEIKAVIQLVHGMNEHKERYIDFMRFLAQNGYACFIHDHRGHGTSLKNEEDIGYFYDAKAEAVLAASLFHYKELEIMDLKNYLADKGVSVRR